MPRLTTRAVVLAACAAALALPRAAVAQDSVVVLPGARVRLRADSTPGAPWRVGTLAAVRSDTLLVRPCPRCVPDAFMRGSVSTFEASVGRPHRTGTGLLLGVLAAGAVLEVQYEQCRAHYHSEAIACGIAIESLPAYVIAGGFGGAFVGSLIPAGAERWRPARPVASAREARPLPPSHSSWFGEPVPGARGGAQLGALLGVVGGAGLALGLPCRRPAQEFCAFDQMMVGAVAGTFAGSVLGAGAGASAVSHCPPRASFARALGGAALWSVPALLYGGLVAHRDPLPSEMTFAVAVSLPLLQAEGAARAASGACERGGR